MKKSLVLSMLLTTMMFGFPMTVQAGDEFSLLKNKESGLCLNVKPNPTTGTVAGQGVFIDNCKDTNDQMWRIMSDGRIVNDRYGLCLEALGGGQGGTVGINFCRDMPLLYQEWELRGDKIYNVRTHFCLDVSAYNPISREYRPGDSLYIGGCDAPQTWSFVPAVIPVIPDIDMKVRGCDGVKNIYLDSDKEESVSNSLKKWISYVTIYVIIRAIEMENSDRQYDITYVMKDPEEKIYSYIAETGEWKEGVFISVTSKINADEPEKGEIITVIAPVPEMDKLGKYTFFISLDDADGKIAAMQTGDPLYYKYDYVDVLVVGKGICAAQGLSGPETVMWKGLEWQRCDDGQKYNEYEAEDVCVGLVLGGHDDWRLPSKDELMSLQVPQNKPAIDPQFSCHSTYYWSSTPNDTLPNFGDDSGWIVDFLYGHGSTPCSRGENYTYVRCVR